MNFLVGFVCLVVMVTTCHARCRDRNSIPGYYLEGHVITSQIAADVLECVRACDQNLRCRSINYVFLEKKCEINDANRFSYPDDYKNKGRGYIYGDSLRAYNSCAGVKLADPEAKNGYYEIFLKTKPVQVYCDMEKYGGGWTLVVGISAKNNEHLQRTENNCETLELCVPFITTSVPSRKMDDGDIRWLASTEGIFRVDDLDSPFGVNTAFFKIPSGASNFNSGCIGGSCHRLIVSHSFPYSWESGCAGLKVGYQLYTGTGVFDTSSFQCGSWWYSSQHASRRVLYAYTNGNTGLYNNRQGLLFVK